MDSTTTSWAASLEEWLESTLAWDDKTTYSEVARDIESWKREWRQHVMRREKSSREKDRPC